MSVGQINKILTEDLCVPEVSWIAQVQPYFNQMFYEIKLPL